VRSVEFPASEVVNVFVHGFGGSWMSWTPLLQAAFDAKVPIGDILIPDLPGFGMSSRDSDHLDMKQIGTLLLDLAIEIGWKKIRIIGHSMGGFLSLDMASGLDPRIIAVATISGAYLSIIDVVQQGPSTILRFPRTAIGYYGMRALSSLGPVGPLLVRGIYKIHLLPFFLKNSIHFPNQIKPEILMELSRAVNPRSFQLSELNGVDYDAKRIWSAIDVPSLFIFGGHDNIVPPRDMATISKILPKAQVVSLPDSGHFSHFEQPYEVLRLLGPFLQSANGEDELS